MKGLIPWRKRKEDLMSSRLMDDSDWMTRGRMGDVLEDLFKDFEDILELSPLMRHEESGLSETPNVEVSETDDEMCVKAELPGMDEKDIKVDLEGDELTICGEKRREHEEKHRDYYVSEVGYGEFSRSIKLPEGLDRDHVKAVFKKGVLTLTLPKTEKGKTMRKRIDVMAA